MPQQNPPIKYIYQYECCHAGYYGPATTFKEAYDLLIQARANHQLVKWCQKDQPELSQIFNVQTKDTSTIKTFNGLPTCFKEKTA